MEQRVYGVPEKIDTDIAGYALDAMELTNEQRRYQNSS
jgi:S-adenosylhomocysteine hydrolase